MARIMVVSAFVALGAGAAAVATEVDSEAIRVNIESSLASTHVLADDRVSVGYEKGHATLSGTVHTLYQKWKAGEVTSRVRDVVTLDDNIAVARGTESDSVVAAKIRRRFEDIPKVAAAKLEVRVLDGTVILKGAISDARVRFDARDAAAQIPGVTEVFDRISSPAAPDHRLKKGAETLIGPGSLDRVPGDITVDVLGGVVHLEGWVPRLWDRVDAERRILGMNGVREVINDLEVKPRKRPDADWR